VGHRREGVTIPFVTEEGTGAIEETETTSTSSTTSGLQQTTKGLETRKVPDYTLSQLSAPAPAPAPAPYSMERTKLTPALTYNPISPAPDVPVGARLSHYWPLWKSLGMSKSVVNILKDGLKWKFKEPPVLRNHPWRVQEHLSQTKREAMTQVIDKLLAKGAIEEVTNLNSLGHYSILFLRRKTSGDFRPILDLKVLNKCIVNSKFRMESARSIQEAMKPDEWACSIDLTDAYFHIPVNKGFRKYLRFAVLGKAYQYRALPFGLLIAPRVFTAVMLEVAKILRERGVVMHLYLDDWIFRHLDPQSLSGQVQMILTLLDYLGLLVNLPKSDLSPLQIIEFVGVLYDLALGRAYPPAKRVEKIATVVEALTSQQVAPASLWLTLIGLLGSVSDQVPLGRLHIRPIQFHLSNQWKMAVNARTDPVTISQEIIEHLRWWTSSDTLKIGVPLMKFKPDVSLFTDASMTGWGAHLDGQEVAGVWDTQTTNLVHINILEMRAVRLALKELSKSLAGKAVLVATDNTTVLAYINHQGGTRSWSLMEETKKLFLLAEQLGVSLKARHIPGKLNVLADKLSRKNQILQTEWSIHPAVLESLWQMWGKPMIDLFATRHNYKLQLFVSPVPDALACAVDALTMSWDNLSVYAYPPSGLIKNVVSKLQESRNCSMVLIAPRWTDKPWFPELLKLIQSPPVPLPLREDLLKQPQSQTFHQNLSVLKLHAWRLSSKQ
jgi:hypothetical protein